MILLFKEVSVSEEFIVMSAHTSKFFAFPEHAKCGPSERLQIAISHVFLE